MGNNGLAQAMDILDLCGVSCKIILLCLIGGTSSTVTLSYWQRCCFQNFTTRFSETDPALLCDYNFYV